MNCLELQDISTPLPEPEAQTFEKAEEQYKNSEVSSLYDEKSEKSYDNESAGRQQATSARSAIPQNGGHMVAKFLLQATESGSPAG